MRMSLDEFVEENKDILIKDLFEYFDDIIGEMFILMIDSFQRFNINEYAKINAIVFD